LNKNFETSFPHFSKFEQENFEKRIRKFLFKDRIEILMDKKESWGWEQKFSFNYQNQVQHLRWGHSFSSHIAFLKK
jgi:hypothetical protein